MKYALIWSFFLWCILLIFKSAQKIFGGEVKNHILLFIKKSDKDFDTKLGDFKEAAKDFKGEVGPRWFFFK